MKRIMLLLPLLLVACSTSPRKQYSWTSFSEKGLTPNTIAVLREAQGFDGKRGEDKIEVKKEASKPLAADTVKKIILLGDTGCRLKESKYGDSYQNCKDGKDWIYASVIEKIWAENADLIVHVGDYHYREQCSEGKICRQYTHVVGYNWKAWEADFFSPSQKAFNKPWIFVRGNHEDCKRAYEGYKLISEQTWAEKCIKAERTEYLRLGNLLIVQMDTSAISDKPESAEELAFWEQQFKDIEAEVTKIGAKKVWLITHKPIVGFVEDDKHNLQTSNINLQKAMAKTGLAKKIHLMVAGHIHNTQLVHAQGYPTQLVVGNSGSALDDFKLDREKILKNKIDGIKFTDFFSDTKSGHSFGYAVMTKQEGDNWQLQFKDAKGEVTYTWAHTVFVDKMNLNPPKKKKK